MHVLAHCIPGRPAFLALGLAAMLVTSGCASLNTPATPEEIVKERAQARWDATLARKYDVAYGLTAPSYRTLVEFEKYRAKHGMGGGISKQGAKVYRVYCPSESACKAVITIDYVSFMGPKPGSPSSTAYEESWVLEAGNWWFLPR